jgi:hypothetical protein
MGGVETGLGHFVAAMIGETADGMAMVRENFQAFSVIHGFEGVGRRLRPVGDAIT